MGIYTNNTFAPAVKINQPIVPSGSLSITAGGRYDVYSYSSITVSVQDLLDMRLTSTLNIGEYVDTSASMISPGAFAFQRVSSVNMPNVTYVGKSAFASCTGLTSINLPACESLDTCAFYYCSDLPEINLPNCSIIGFSAFANCSKLVSVSLPKCSSVGAGYTSTFAYCGKLRDVYLPSLTYAGGMMFYICSSLASINLPVCTSISYNAFYSCSVMSTVSLPNCSIFGGGCFQYCYSLASVSLPACTSLSTSVFNKCYNLLSVYLNVSAVPSLANVNAFASTPISNYTTSTGGVQGSIYVPTSLYSSFITATNWATYSARIVSMTF